MPISDKQKVLFKFYVLIDPRDNQIKYVGRTVNEKNRYNNHIYESKRENKNKKQRWIVSLLNKNLKPEMKVIYSIYCLLNEAIQTEKILVKKLLKKGYKLKNEADNYLGAVLTGTVVHQYDLNGYFIKTFANSHQADINTGVKDCNILRCCYGKGNSAGNFIWSFEKLEKLSPYNSKWRQYKGKPIIAIDNKGNKKEFLTSRIAAKELNINYKKISAVLNGNIKHIKGYTFDFNI